MKRILIIGVIAIAVATLVAAYGFDNRQPEIDVDSDTVVTNGLIEVSPMSIDYGDIVQSNGPVSATVIVSNVGDTPLVINRLSTSCGCTSAEMDLSDIAPSEERELKITFDPMVHPDQLGSIVRVVYLQTSDPNTPEIEINVLGNVIK